MQLGGDVTQIEKIRQCKYVCKYVLRMCSDEISCRAEKPVRFPHWNFSERQGAQELACAREGV